VNVNPTNLTITICRQCGYETKKHATWCKQWEPPSPERTGPELRGAIWQCAHCERVIPVSPEGELLQCEHCQPTATAQATMPAAHALYEEAERLISGPRKSTYGHYTAEAASIAAMWTELLRDVLREGAVVEPRKVPLMMIALKLNRMKVKRHEDSLADTCGYAGLLAELEVRTGEGGTK
jgi:hypothetical protein